MDRAFSTHKTKVHIRFCLENLKEIDHWQELDIDGMVILK
jgi:hypothetical protein